MKPTPFQARASDKDASSSIMNLFGTCDVGPKTSSVQRGLEVKDRRVLHDLTIHDVQHISDSVRRGLLHWSLAHENAARLTSTLARCVPPCAASHLAIHPRTPRATSLWTWRRNSARSCGRRSARRAARSKCPSGTAHLFI